MEFLENPVDVIPLYQEFINNSFEPLNSEHWQPSVATLLRSVRSRNAGRIIFRSAVCATYSGRLTFLRARPLDRLRSAGVAARALPRAQLRPEMALAVFAGEVGRDEPALGCRTKIRHSSLDPQFAQGAPP